MTSCLTSSSGDTSCTCCPRASTAYRHYDLFANGDHVTNIARARELLGAEPRSSVTPQLTSRVRRRDCQRLCVKSSDARLRDMRFLLWPGVCGHR